MSQSCLVVILLSAAKVRRCSICCCYHLIGRVIAVRESLPGGFNQPSHSQVFNQSVWGNAAPRSCLRFVSPERYAAFSMSNSSA